MSEVMAFLSDPHTWIRVLILVIFYYSGFRNGKRSKR